MQPNGYSRAQITLHWVIAILIVVQFVFHDAIVATWQATLKGETPDSGFAVLAHIWCGSAILALGIWRLVLRFQRGVPALPEQEHVILRMLAHLTHWMLYALMILMPISGLATWFGASATADFVHTTLKLPLFGFVLLHVAGALFQQFILRTGLIKRMIRAEASRKQ